MNKAIAFSPGHITGFFQIYIDTASSLRTGSRGAGVSLARGVTSQVEPSDKLEIYINGLLQKKAEVSERTLALFLEATGREGSDGLKISHTIDLPVGCGFGTSGAGALSLVFALNHYFKSSLTFDQQVSIAHRAEVELKTGLGTVMGEAYGGMEIRETAGAPGFGKVFHIDIDNSYKVLCLLFGKMATSDLLGDPGVRERINRAGGSFVDDLSACPSSRAFKEYSRKFALGTGLVPSRLKEAMDALAEAEITASMLMFGDGLFVIEKEDKLTSARQILEKFRGGGELIFSDIDFNGVRVL